MWCLDCINSQEREVGHLRVNYLLLFLQLDQGKNKVPSASASLSLLNI